MWKKLGRLIINNFGLKVLAVVFAIVLWLIIVNTVDPEKAATFTVPVEVVNAGYLTDEGLTYEILDNTDYVTFTVSGKRSIVENLTADDFRATANMSDIDDTMTMVPVSLAATSYSGQLEITRRQSYMMVSVEPFITREYEINVVVDGSPAGSYFVESTEVSPSVVTVSGAESLVDEIDSAQTSIIVNGAEETFSSTETVYLLNENGIVLDEERLDVDVIQAEVTANILLAKSVPVTFAVTGEPAEGYIAGAPECDTDSLVITGLPEVLDGIEEIVLESPLLNIEGMTSDCYATVNVSQILPDGVSLYEDQPQDLDVYVPIMPAITRVVEMPAENITFDGLAEGLSAVISIDPLTVTVTGLEEEVEKIEGDDLQGVVDASDLGVGNHLITLMLETDGTYNAKVTFTVSITEEETEPGTEEESAEEEETESRRTFGLGPG